MPGGEGDLIEFTPSVAGKYKLTLTYGGDEVAGSPLVYTVQEDRTPTVFGKGLTLGQVSQVALFKIDGRGLEASVLATKETISWRSPRPPTTRYQSPSSSQLYNPGETSFKWR